MAIVARRLVGRAENFRHHRCSRPSLPLIFVDRPRLTIHDAETILGGLAISSGPGILDCMVHSANYRPLAMRIAVLGLFFAIAALDRLYSRGPGEHAASEARLLPRQGAGRRRRVRRAAPKLVRHARITAQIARIPLPRPHHAALLRELTSAVVPTAIESNDRHLPIANDPHAKTCHSAFDTRPA
jgi:hypothetical protein